ncbi:MAG: iron ABC transporter permease [Methylobacteriaceae bacterium]|jgi:iron(III) transport system permease protein|nr:iron ABC transporter permease [Methylobacteriaceae bacterium]
MAGLVSAPALATPPGGGDAARTASVTASLGVYPILGVIWLSLIIFVLYPLFELLKLVFWQDGVLTFKPLMDLLEVPYNVKALYNSLFLGAAVAVSGTFLGFCFAYFTVRMRAPFWLKWIIATLTLLPLISPPFTSAISLSMVLGPNGMILKMLGIPQINLYGFWLTWTAETLTYFPVAYLALSAVLVSLDPSMEDAALSLGSSPWRVFYTVTLPMTTPGLANSLLLLFANSLADFATPLVLAGTYFPVLPTQAYLQITGLYDYRGGAGLSFLLLVPALAAYLLQHYWVSRRSYVTITGKSGARSPVRGMGAIGEGFIFTLCLLLSAFVVLLYAIILQASLVKVFGVNHTFTLEHFEFVFRSGQKAIRDTLIIAAIVTPVGGLMAVIIGFITFRWKSVANMFLDFTCMLNYALPGTVVGIAYVLAFNEEPLQLTNGLTILVTAYIFRYFAAGIRSVVASLHQIDKNIEEASASLGASGTRTFFKITLPLVIPAVLAGMRYLFIHSMTAISATIFLVSVNWTLLTTRILEAMSGSELARASAFSVVLIVLVFISSGIMAYIVKTYSARLAGAGES